MNNQDLKTLDVIILFSLFVALTAFVTHVVSRGQQESLASKARRTAENISSQLLSVRLKTEETLAAGDLRGLASQPLQSGGKRLTSKRFEEFGTQGIIGMDPWGQPFHYKFVAAEQGLGEVLMIWSAGPDGQFARSYATLSFQDLANMTGLFADSDDVGHLAQVPSSL